MRGAPRSSRTGAGLALLASLALACSGMSSLPRGFGKLWEEYEAMPEHRAFALAGDPEDVWVAGATGGHASRQAAADAALEECERRRLVRRVVSPCRLYAVGSRRILAN